MRKSKKILTSLLAIMLMSGSTVTSVSATSSSRTDSNGSLSATIRSDVWIQTFSDFDGTGEFQVTAAYNSTNNTYKTLEYVKAAWSFYTIGINVGVSYVGISATATGSGATSSSSGYWKNSNGAKTSWWRGRVGGTGLCFYVGLYNTASAFKSGVAISTTAKV